MNNKRRKEPLSTKKLIILIIVLVLIAAVIIVGVKFLREKVTETYGSDDSSEVQSAEVTTGSISTTVSGDGTLAFEDSDDLTLPSTVEVNEIYVSAGEEVAAGDLLASVNESTVVEAMAELQEEIDDIDDELTDVADDSVSSTISASVSGRVKDIYVSAGDDVADVMYENNALMLISLDGYMAVDITTDALAVDDDVTVTDEDGTSYDGTVDSVIDGVATILITDKGPDDGATVTVTDSDDTEIGSGSLYIHESLAVTGYAGTVYSVSVSENSSVSSGTTLITLTDTSYSANYQSLLEEREDLEDQLQDLIVVYKEGGVYAQEAGTVTSITEGDYTYTASTDDSSSMGAGGSSSSSSSDSSSSGETVISICSSENMDLEISVDESDILSLEDGQEATITIDSLSDETYTGTVTSIDSEGSSSSGVTTYTATIQLAKETGMLSGMSASAVISIDGTENALLIPYEALNQTSSTAYVYTSYDEETGELGDMVEVTVGISNSTYVEITDGLSEGDTVYYTEATEEEESFDMNGMQGMPGSSGGDMGGMGGSDSNMGGSGSSGGGKPSGGPSGN